MGYSHDEGYGREKSYGHKVGYSHDEGYGREEGYGKFNEQFGRKSWTVDPIQYQVEKRSDQYGRQEAAQAKLRGDHQYGRGDPFPDQLTKRSEPDDGGFQRREELKAGRTAHQDQKYLPEFEWTEIHPVVKTTSRFLIDRTPLSFVPKTLPLPPLGGSGEEGESNKKSPPSPPQHSVLHIRLPNVLL